MNQMVNALFRNQPAQKQEIPISLQQKLFPDLFRLYMDRPHNAVRNPFCFSAVCAFKVVLHIPAKHDNLVCKTDSHFFTHMDILGAKAAFPLFSLPIQTMNGDYDPLSKQFRKPAKKAGPSA